VDLLDELDNGLDPVRGELTFVFGESYGGPDDERLEALDFKQGRQIDVSCRVEAPLSAVCNEVPVQ